MVTKETENTIQTGELLHDIEQEATIVTCVEGLNSETANYALSRIWNCRTLHLTAKSFNCGLCEFLLSLLLLY